MIQCVWSHVSTGKQEGYWVVSPCKGWNGQDIFALFWCFCTRVCTLRSVCSKGCGSGKPTANSQQLVYDWSRSETSCCLATWLGEDAWQPTSGLETGDKDADWAAAFVLKILLLTTCVLRGFHHKGACKGKSAVACRGLGAGTNMPVCERMRRGEGTVGGFVNWMEGGYLCRCLYLT